MSFSDLELDVDVHQFTNISLNGLNSLKPKLSDIIFDFGITIEGNGSDNDELPECMLWSARVGKWDFSKAHVNRDALLKHAASRVASDVSPPEDEMADAVKGEAKASE